MKVNLGREMEFEFFQIEDAGKAEKLAQETHGVLYSWKTEGRSNWLQQGFSIVNVLGLTVLNAGLSEIIDLPDDGKNIN